MKTSKLLIATALLMVCAACTKQYNQPYIEKYYVHDDDDGTACIFHADSTVDLYICITREHVRGIYTCDFPNVSITITEIDNAMTPELRIYTEVPMAYPYPLWFSLNADTLYREHNNYTEKMTPTSWSHFMLYRIGL